MKQFFFVALLILFLSGCAGTNFSWDSVDELEEGMTVNQAMEIMKTKPYANSITGNQQMMIWSYAVYTNAKSVSLLFEDGKLKTITKVNPSVM
ncbi:lipoprotein [Vibrio agarivorans]|uniref:lipoprotein n=1 Tax=Vibrio agarivorans TaxID=153622 RepID=UPI0022310F66|nr:lipoprotein [Vibrio agarivorans]